VDMGAKKISKRINGENIKLVEIDCTTGETKSQKKKE
jgi:hypothetical protein